MKKFDLKVASAGTIEGFVRSSNTRSSGGGLGQNLSGQGLLQKLEEDLEALESHLVDLNRYSERLTSEYNEKVGGRLTASGVDGNSGECTVALGYSCAAVIHLLLCPSRHELDISVVEVATLLDVVQRNTV